MACQDGASAERERHPPGPKARYPWGNLLEYARNPLEFLTKCCRVYGDVVRVHFPGPPVFIISDPEQIESILVKNSRNFIKEREVRKDLSLLGEGLLTSEGALWRRQRKLAQPAFHHERVNAYGKVMVEYAQRMLSSLWRDGRSATCIRTWRAWRFRSLRRLLSIPILREKPKM